MKSNIIFGLFVLLGILQAKEVDESKYLKRFDIVQNVLEDLQAETWGIEEFSCVDATKSILNGLKNNTLWAAWVWNSMQLPVGTFYGSAYNLGNFDQCLQTPWPSSSKLQTQYCLVDVKLTASNKYDGKLAEPYDDAVRYLGGNFRYGLRLNTIHLGVCLPASCKPDSVAKISRVLFKQSLLPFRDVVVDPRDCQVAGTVPKPLGYYVFLFIILFMVFTCISAYFLGKPRDKSETIVPKILSCFCLSRNFEALSDVPKSDIKSLNGIKTVTCILLNMGHYYYILIYFTYINKLDAIKAVTSNPLKLTIHVDLFVDTFLLISGLLFFRGVLSSRSYQPFLTLINRYFRFLLPMYALTIAGVTYVAPYIGSGPAWPRLARRLSEPCAKSWWQNFLMITNKVDDKSVCLDYSWYIHCDFQLTILGTIIFIMYQKSKKLGFFVLCLAYFTTIVVPMIWTYWKDIPGIMVYNLSPECRVLSKNIVYNSVYTPIYTRGSAYLIGMATGYILTVYKPQEHRKIISKTNSILGFMVGLATLTWTLHIGANQFEKEYGAFTTAILAAIDKTIWSFGTAIIIIVCEYGTLPIISDLLNSKVFVVLSKFCYSNYLIHMILMNREVYSLRAPPKYDYFDLTTHGFGHVVMTFSICFLAWMFIEAPVTNLINLIYGFNRNHKTQKGAGKFVSKIDENNTKYH